MTDAQHHAGEPLESIGVVAAQAAAVPRVYVFCNSHSYQWHSFIALAEDGTVLAGHVCSDHGFAPYDMGATEEQDWSKKRALYAAHYPNGYEVEVVEVASKADVLAHAGLNAALDAAVARNKP